MGFKMLGMSFIKVGCVYTVQLYYLNKMDAPIVTIVFRHAFGNIWTKGFYNLENNYTICVKSRI